MVCISPIRHLEGGVVPMAVRVALCVLAASPGAATEEAGDDHEGREDYYGDDDQPDDGFFV